MAICVRFYNLWFMWWWISPTGTGTMWWSQQAWHVTHFQFNLFLLYTSDHDQLAV